jgi:hypothetical protein
MELNLTEYIADVVKDGASAFTLKAYNRAIERTGIAVIDTDKLPELYQTYTYTLLNVKRLSRQEANEVILNWLTV